MTAKKTASKTSRSTRTKAELEEQIEALEARLEEQPEIGQQAALLQKEHVKEVRSAVAGVPPIEKIVADAAQLGLNISRQLTDITGQTTTAKARLEEIQEAIKVETDELARLYDIDVAAASVKALLEEHTANKEMLEREQVAARASWAEEISINAKSVSARNNELEQARRREQNEYDYKTRQDRQRANDEFAQTMLLQTREQADRINSVEKDLANRTAAIMAEENTIAALKARFAGLEEEIDVKSKTAAAIATNSLKKELTGQFQLEKKDLETSLKVLEQQKIAVDQANEKLAQQVTTLISQLEAARAQVIEVSNNALLSASGQVALTAVRETVKENGAQGGGRKS